MKARMSLFIAGALLGSACGGNQNMFNPQGPAARSIATLGWVLLAVSGVVYVLVLAAMVWALARKRRPSDAHPETDRVLTQSIAAAVAVTALTLVAMTVSSHVAGRGLVSPSGPGAITIDVVGHQWWWDFRYRDVTPSDVVNSPNELHIPVGVPVVLIAQSRDVIHSFWVPNLQGKRDLIPGHVTSIWLQADEPGVYRGQCAEFCGHQHANMAVVVVAEPMDRFQQWLQQQRRPAAEPADDRQRRGRDVFLQSSCVSCHTVRGTDAGSRFGPDLTHVASRRTIAAGTLPNTREHLGEWVGNSQAVKPGNRMPSDVVLAENRDALLGYLRSLR
jgi:cytochrome c oxidase subunit II